MNSIHLDDLEKLLDLFCQQMSEKGGVVPEGGFTSEHLRGYLISEQIWPPRDYPDRFSKLMPHCGLTYMWLSIRVKDVVPYLRNLGLKQLGNRNITVWVDIIMSNQYDGNISSALILANRIYMGADYHLAILGVADYPIYDSDGNAVILRNGKVKTSPNFTWDRCWCVAEFAMRDFAVDEDGKSATIIVLPPEHRQRVMKQLTAFPEGYDFFSALEGRPTDIDSIQKMLLSLYGTEENFNIQFQLKLSKVLVECQVHTERSFPSTSPTPPPADSWPTGNSPTGTYRTPRAASAFKPSESQNDAWFR